MSDRPPSTHKTQEAEHPATRKDAISYALRCVQTKDDPLTPGQHEQLGRVRKDLVRDKATAAGIQSVEMQSALFFAFTNFRRDIRDNNKDLRDKNDELKMDLNNQTSKCRELRRELEEKESTIKRLEEDIKWLKQYLPPPERTVVINFKGSPPDADVAPMAALAAEPYAQQTITVQRQEPPPKRQRTLKIKSTIVDPKVNASKVDEAAATAQKGLKSGSKKTQERSHNPFHKVLDQLTPQAEEPESDRCNIVDDPEEEPDF
jgi:hypothetical protein